MGRDKGGLLALTGLAFLVLAVVGIAIGGEPVDADNNAREVVDSYVDKQDSIRVAVFIHVAALVLLVYFGAFLRDVLRAAEGDRDFLPTVAFAGTLVLATGLAIDNTIALALAETAGTSTPQPPKR